LFDGGQVDEHHFIHGVRQDEISAVDIIRNHTTIRSAVTISGEKQKLVGSDGQATRGADHMRVGIIIAQRPAVEIDRLRSPVEDLEPLPYCIGNDSGIRHQLRDDQIHSGGRIGSTARPRERDCRDDAAGGALISRDIDGSHLVVILGTRIDREIEVLTGDRGAGQQREGTERIGRPIDGIPRKITLCVVEPIETNLALRGHCSHSGGDGRRSRIGGRTRPDQAHEFGMIDVWIAVLLVAKDHIIT